MSIWFFAGLILMASGIVNLILLSRDKRKEGKKPPTLKQLALSRFFSTFTFFVGLFLFVSSTNSLS